VAPGTVGRPAAGVKLKILDEEGLELPAGETGRIFISNPILFDGYTGGGTKQVLDGFMSSGDVGHVDDHGRLFIDGRDDDMILSGGENVFPQEVEETLASHEAVADAAAFGVPDEDFGQRLAAFVVLKSGGSATAFTERLPRTSTGKIQRRRLADLYQDQEARK
jgi:fatty-acyl-CoA synthase